MKKRLIVLSLNRNEKADGRKMEDRRREEIKMNILALIITLLIIATALFFGFYFFIALRKEGGGKIKKGIEICCTKKIKRLKIEKSEIEEARNFYPVSSLAYERGTLAMAIWDLKIAIYKSLIKK